MILEWTSVTREENQSESSFIVGKFDDLNFKPIFGIHNFIKFQKWL